MGMGLAPTWLRQVSAPASQNHFNHNAWSGGGCSAAFSSGGTAWSILHLYEPSEEP